MPEPFCVIWMYQRITMMPSSSSFHDGLLDPAELLKTPVDVRIQQYSSKTPFGNTSLKDKIEGAFKEYNFLYP